MREAIKRRGGEWHPETATWSLRYADALTLRLLGRITGVRGGAGVGGKGGRR